MAHKHISRRKFLGQASCAAIGSSTLLSTITNLMSFNSLSQYAANENNDYKALVCILLAGGNDSFNMLVPMGEINDFSEDSPQYQEYLATRTSLALGWDSLLPITANTPDGKLYGMHPSMGALHQMFNNGEAAFLSNVGTLINPIANVDEYYATEANLPLGLFSHSDQIQQWQTSVPQSRQAIGWGGKMADLIQAQYNSNQNFSMNISLSGRNVFQSGNTVSEFSISNQGNGLQGLEIYRPWMGNAGFLHELKTQSIDDMSSQIYSDILKQALGNATKQSFESIEAFSNAIANVTPFTTGFSDNYVSANMHMIARTIAAQSELNMCRQTFFVTFGGWDHHDEVIDNQMYMLGVLSNAISELNNALGEIGMKDKVTTFTVSDFARTLTSNGNGSDHAWGGQSIIAGGAVNGQDMFGSFPDLYIENNPLMTDSRGRLIPTTSTDAYFAELALWFGVSPSDLPLILPNIGNFYDTTSNQMPIGFLPWTV